MSELFAPVVSITTTKRRRFFWAAWTSGPPVHAPFRRPDASDGGARGFDEAKAAAEARTGHGLVVIDPLWARAWIRLVRGEDAWPSKASMEPAVARERVEEGSVWAILGVTRGVDEAGLKAAYRKKLVETHPDQGGSDAAVRDVVRAYREALSRVKRPRRREG